MAPFAHRLAHFLHGGQHVARQLQRRHREPPEVESGLAGELAGLLAIRGYHHSRGDVQRDVCLIPSSAHGTNAASAVLAGMRVVVVACDDAGNVDLGDLRAKIAAHADALEEFAVSKSIAVKSRATLSDSPGGSGEARRRAVGWRHGHPG